MAPLRPQRRRTPVRRAARRGFSLLELLLVAGMLLMAGALAAVNLAALRESNRLHQQADDLRGLLSGLRTNAIEDGVPYELALGAGGTSYILRKADDAASVAGTADADGRVEFDDAGALGEHPLPAKLRLVASGSAGANAGSVRSGSGSGSGSGAAGAAGTATGALVRFEPDGTASSAGFRLVDDEQGAYVFQVRSATGVVTARRESVTPAGRLGGGRF